MNNLTIPDKFDAKGVFTMATELLGLTKDWLIEKAERLIGKENVELIGKVKENVDIYMKDGWSGLWDEHISKNLQGIAGIVVDSITGWIEKKVVIEAVKYIISLFNPVAALLKAIQMGWNIYTFIKENFTKMMNLVSAFTNELANIAQGNVSNAINFVESALAKGLTLGIKLLAKLLNIDKIARAVNEALQKIHDKIDTATNQLIDWLKDKAGSMLQGGNGDGGDNASSGNSSGKQRQ